jgi:hypothetical protein
MEFGNALLPQRFWENVRIRDDGCWEWRGYVDPGGYGIYRGQGVHRVVMSAVRTIPAGLVVDHVCHDPDICRLDARCPHRRCCNLDHLRITTHAQNTLSGASHRSKRENAVKRRTAWQVLNRVLALPSSTHDVDDAVRALLIVGTRPTEAAVARRTGYTRERLRQIMKGK